VAADLGLIVYSAERDAHKVAARGVRDRLAERGRDAGKPLCLQAPRRLCLRSPANPPMSTPVFSRRKTMLLIFLFHPRGIMAGRELQWIFSKTSRKGIEHPALDETS